MTAHIIGVDGGGSHTRVIVADERGAELGAADGGPSAVRPGDGARAAEVIAEVVDRAVKATGLPAGRARCACVGVAGVGREFERESLWDALEELHLADEILVVSDADIALEDAFGERPGLLLICGTGSIAYGRGPTGTLARCGGWGPAFGDEGSGAWLGRRALGVVSAAFDGREPETDLTSPVLAAAGVPTVEALTTWAGSAGPSDLATLAPVVLEVAASGDLRANSLVALAVEELGLHVRALAQRLFADERAAFPLALSGGLLKRGTMIRKRLEHRLKSLTPGAEFRTEEVVAVRGAVKHALRHLAAVKS